MKRIKKLVLIGMVTVCTFVSSMSVFAMSMGDSSNKFGTSGVLKVDFTPVSNTPYLGGCSMDCRGTSLFTFDPKGTGYSKKLIYHRITVVAKGIGSVSFDGGTLSGDAEGNECVYEAGTSDWDFRIITSIWRMYGYGQTHSYQYDLKKGGKKKATVTLSCKYHWGVL